jgi:hypothetical protein
MKLPPKKKAQMKKKGWKEPKKPKGGGAKGRKDQFEAQRGIRTDDTAS